MGGATELLHWELKGLKDFSVFSSDDSVSHSAAHLFLVSSGLHPLAIATSFTYFAEGRAPTREVRGRGRGREALVSAPYHALPLSRLVEANQTAFQRAASP